MKNQIVIILNTLLLGIPLLLWPSENPVYSSLSGKICLLSLPSFVLSPVFFEHESCSGEKSDVGDREPFES